jgi:hypothetical protein
MDYFQPTPRMVTRSCIIRPQSHARPQLHWPSHLGQDLILLGRHQPQAAHWVEVERVAGRFALRIAVTRCIDGEATKASECLKKKSTEAAAHMSVHRES